MPDGEPLQLDVADPGNGVGFDDKLAAVCGGSSDIGLSIELISGPQPGSHGVFVRRSADVQPLAFRHGGLSFSLTSACVLPSTFLLMRLPVFGSYPAVYRPSQRPWLLLRGYCLLHWHVFSDVCSPLFQSCLAGMLFFLVLGFPH